MFNGGFRTISPSIPTVGAEELEDSGGNIISIVQIQISLESHWNFKASS